MNTRKILIVFYSRSGTTRRIAQQLSSTLGCDLEEITESSPRTGWLGYIRSAVEAKRMRCPAIDTPKHAADAYDLVVIGTPVWAWSLSSPVRTYLMKNAAHLRDVAFFCTMGGAGSENVFSQMTTIVGKPPRAVCAITQRQVVSDNYRDTLTRFEHALRT